ncbi:MAG: hypothetical protein MUQ30_01270 [Anaerolineae bacterium]|nr:hypothetical protein [Anaerolineae bacterium]
MVEIPHNWRRAGLVLPRNAEGAGSEVIGDPCIVWDEEVGGWRMFLFSQPPGHGQAICLSQNEIGPGQWEFLGPLTFTNSEALLGGSTHKPFIVMDSRHMNRAALIDGRYCLVAVSFLAGHKVVQQAWAEKLSGPWTLEPDVLIPPGSEDAFDGKHVDAVTAYYFSEREEILYTYMGYPLQAQPREGSPYGSAQGVATQRVGAKHVEKLGVILPPSRTPGHWAAGWVGGLQLMPGKAHRWLAVVNASPTPPDPSDAAISREEPPPSLGGFAYTDEAWPIGGWEWCPQPIEWIDDIPAAALVAGEGTNLWRQHILALPNGSLALLYNSGYYGVEQLYMKIA